MDRYIPLLRGGMPTKESTGSSVVYQTSVPPLHHAAEITERSGRPYTENKSGCEGSRQFELQEDEENTHGGRR